MLPSPESKECCRGETYGDDLPILLQGKASSCKGKTRVFAVIFVHPVVKYLTTYSFQRMPLSEYWSLEVMSAKCHSYVGAYVLEASALLAFLLRQYCAPEMCPFLVCLLSWRVSHARHQCHSRGRYCVGLSTRQHNRRSFKTKLHLADGMGSTRRQRPHYCTKKAFYLATTGSRLKFVLNFVANTSNQICLIENPSNPLRAIFGKRASKFCSYEKQFGYTSSTRITLPQTWESTLTAMLYLNGRLYSGIVHSVHRLFSVFLLL